MRRRPQQNRPGLLLQAAVAAGMQSSSTVAHMPHALQKLKTSNAVSTQGAHLDLGHAAGRGRDAVQAEGAQRLVVPRKLALALRLARVVVVVVQVGDGSAMTCAIGGICLQRRLGPSSPPRFLSSLPSRLPSWSHNPAHLQHVDLHTRLAVGGGGEDLVLAGGQRGVAGDDLQGRVEQQVMVSNLSGR